jgi:glycosyltransferase involved in cell wall biosynthesis
VLGFDFVHAWRNRRGIRSADVVWTHTESQYLAVLLLLQARPRAERPKIIAQSVWLFDHWHRLLPPLRRLYASLIRQADVLTVHSPENLRVARRLFPECRSEMVPFGIRTDALLPRGPRPFHRPVRVLSLGSDRHRDWTTLVTAAKEWDGCELRLVSRSIDRALVGSAANVTVVQPANNEELLAHYDWADLVVLALKPNLHASGITVVQEATVYGLPVVCSDTGGLAAYFRDAEVAFVAPGDPAAIRARVGSLAAADDGERWAMVERARRRMAADGLNSRRFAQRHVELSRELLAAAPQTEQERAPRRRTLRRVLTAMPLLAAVSLAAQTLGATPESPPANDATIDLCAYRPTFIEDFDTLSVSAWGEDGSRWIAHTPWHGDFGDAEFTDPRPGFPFRVRDGVLEIEARKNADGKWQSGLLASATPSGTGFAQRYGYFEMRAELPPGPGTWPAFWLNANVPRGWKEPSVEIDVLEYYGQFTDAYHSVVHFWDNGDLKKSRVEDHITKVPPGSLTSSFHTYGVNVASDWLTFYLDRRETWKVRTPPEMQAPFMVLVNLALGSGWPIDQTPNPSVMKVDYIHVYAPRAPGETKSCPAAQTGTGGKQKGGTAR